MGGEPGTDSINRHQKTGSLLPACETAISPLGFGVKWLFSSPEEYAMMKTDPDTEGWRGSPGKEIMMATLKHMRGKYLLTLLAMCGLVSSALGIMTNAGGIFFPPIAEEFGQPTAAVNLTLTISNLAFAVAGMFSARLVKPKNFHLAISIYSLIFAGATALLSVCQGMVPLYIFSAVRGFAAGVVGNVLATSVIGKWFLSDTGFITSLALGSSGIVGALFNPVLDAVIQSAGWRTAYLAAAGIILLLNLPAMVLPISFLPEDSGLTPLGSPAPGSDSGRETATGRKAVPGLAVLMLILISFSFVSFASAVPQLFKPITGTYGLAETGIVMMSIVLIANTAGKFLLGMMTDRIGVKRSFLIYGLVVMGGVLLLLLVRVSGVLMVSSAMIGLCYSLPTVAAVMICRALFSADQYSKVFPKVNLGVSVANAVGYPILGAIYDKTGEYDSALILIAAVIALAIGGVFLVYRLISRSPERV